MSLDMYVKILLPVSDCGYAPGGTYREVEGLERCWDVDGPDKYHIRLRRLGTYMATNDLREYVAARNPGWDMTNWGYSCRSLEDGDMEVHASCGSKTFDIPSARAEGLIRDHVDVCMHEMVAEQFDLEGFDVRAVRDMVGGWNYVDDGFLSKFKDALAKADGETPADELVADIRECCEGNAAGNHSLPGLLERMVAYAGRIGGKAVLFIE